MPDAGDLITATATPAGARGRRVSPIDAFVGARIRQRRKHIAMSQETLGEALGLTFQQVQKYERGDNRVSAGRLHALAGALGVAVGYFFEGLGEGATALDADGAATVALTTLPHGLEIAAALPRLSASQRQAIRTIVEDLAGGGDI